MEKRKGKNEMTDAKHITNVPSSVTVSTKRSNFNDVSKTLKKKKKGNAS